MSNRIVAFLTLVVIFLVGGALAWWYFSQGVSQIVLHISGPKSSVAILEKGGSNMLETTCSSGECIIDRVPPFTYNLKVSADGYLPYLEDLDIKSNSRIERTITLSRDIRLSEFHTQDASLKIARKNAITAIESASGIVVWGYENSVFFFANKNADTWELRKVALGVDIKSAKTVSTFTTVDTPQIQCFNEADGLAGLFVGKDSLIFDARTQKVSIFLGAHPESSAGDGISSRKIRNISRSGDTLLISTVSGAVILSPSGAMVESPLYDDIFTLPNGDILGLVRPTSSAKKSLLSLPDDQKSYIFLEKPLSPRAIVLESDEDIDHFATEESQILVINTDGGKFKVENILK